MKQIDNILISVFSLLLGLLLGLVLNNHLRKDRLTPPVVIKHKSPKEWILLKGASHKLQFMDGEKAKLIWYEHQVGDTLRMEELR